MRALGSVVLGEDRTLYAILASLITVVAMGWLVAAVLDRLGRSRPELRIGQPVLLAAAARVLCAALFSAVPALQHVRGTDETQFLSEANAILHGVAIGNHGNGIWSPSGGSLHSYVFAGQIKIFGDAGVFHLRLAQIGLGVVAIVLVAVAVYDLAGGRAARLTAWLLAVEPSNVFFSGLVHKEALLLLAGGLLIYGGAQVYTRRRPVGALFIAVAVMLALMIRPYVGIALGAAALAIAAHAGLRRLGPWRRRALVLSAACVVLLIGGTAYVLHRGDILQHLQRSQDSYSQNPGNLTLQPIDVSTPGHLISNLPVRLGGFLFQPFPWQVGDTSQRFGVLGTSVAWVLLATLVVLAIARRRVLVTRAPPLVYMFLAVTVAYALSTGNAGTGFRYRTHVLVAVCALVCVLMPERVSRRAAPVPAT
ncbi:MAG: hypothetical protein QOK25_190 [Thermoleophilaceae bacterium]|nr:hypothetical protein [Thermoleophilaceae bacterium]